MAYHGFKFYAFKRKISHDEKFYRELGKEILLGLDTNKDFKTDFYKIPSQMARILSPWDRYKDASIEGEELQSVLNTVHAVKNGEIADLKKFKLPKDNPLFIKNELNKIAHLDGYYLETLKKSTDEQGEISFAREYLNNPIEEGAVFKPEWMRYTKILPLKEYVKIIAYTDPSFKSTKANDYKATMLVGKTKEGYYHVLKAYAGQCSVAEMVAWHYDIEMWIARKKGRKPPRYYMEANFIQDLLLKEFKDEGVARGGRQIPITPDKRKKPDKYSRIETMQPLFERGFVMFNEEERDSEGLKILIDQLLATEKGSRLHDDAPDALESAIWMLNKVGSDQRNYMTSKRPDRHY